MSNLRNSPLLMTFDVEEFDLPDDLGRTVDPDLADEVAQRGARELARFLRRQQLPATCFVSGSFASRWPREVEELARAGAEIGCHGAVHARQWTARGPAGVEQLVGARRRLSGLAAGPVLGYRSPRFAPISLQLLASAGFRYDSSDHPTWLPGRYNHLARSTVPNRRSGLIEVPVTVLPAIRYPLSWIWFRNMPLPAMARMADVAARRRGLLCVYFHSWEFVDLSGLGLPRPVTRGTGARLGRQLERWLDHRARRASAMTMSSYISQKFPDWERSD